jgi:tyrosine-protein phosphatase SIW14
LQNWALASIFEEYRDHAEPKARILDEQFIDLFDERCLIKVAQKHGFVPGIPARVSNPRPLRSLPDSTIQESELKTKEVTALLV